jgi:hypothetical protein
MFRLPLATLVYGAVFHYAYVAYIYPVWEYAHYGYFAPSADALLFTYLLIAAPVVWYRASAAPAAYGAALIFALCYVPAQLILLFTWERPGGELALVQSSVAASMAIVLRTSGFGGGRSAPLRSERRIVPILGVLTLISVLVLVLTYRENMRLVSFDDIYDLRYEASDIKPGALVEYLISWLSYCFLPFYFTRGILRRNLADIGFGLLGSVLLYAATGAKTAILMPAIIYGLNLLFGSGKDFLFRLVTVLTVTTFLFVQLLPDEGALIYMKSILLVRVLAVGGWTMAVYYDYFSNNGFTYYTHIGPVNALTSAYPYGEYSLGQLIGLQYSGTALANFNANFWASDGFAALGLLGVPVVTGALCAVFFAINRVARGYSPRFVVLWLSGFWLALLNVPLSVALLSGGGLITLLMLWFSARRPVLGAQAASRLKLPRATSIPDSMPTRTSTS